MDGRGLLRVAESCRGLSQRLSFASAREYRGLCEGAFFATPVSSSHDLRIRSVAISLAHRFASHHWPSLRVPAGALRDPRRPSVVRAQAGLRELRLGHLSASKITICCLPPLFGSCQHARASASVACRTVPPDAEGSYIATARPACNGIGID